MSFHDLGNFAIVAIIIVVAIVRQLGGLRKRYGGFVDQQRTAFMQQAAALEQAVAAQQAAAQAAARQATPQRVPLGVAVPQPHRSAPKAAQPAAPARRITQPTVRSMDVPGPPGARRGARILGGAFADAAHARTAIVLAEILGPPVALRRR